jgi:hypothetical protein
MTKPPSVKKTVGVYDRPAKADRGPLWLIIVLIVIVLALGYLALRMFGT